MLLLLLSLLSGDMGVAKDGSHKPTFTPGVDLMAGLTLFGEGCRGSLSQVCALGGGALWCLCLCGRAGGVDPMAGLRLFWEGCRGGEAVWRG